MTKAAELAKMGEVLTNSQIGGRRNLAYNGAMNIAQRGTSETGIGASSGYFTLDRYKMFFANTAGRLTMTQTADGPTGFANCMKLDCTTADTSIAAGENIILSQAIEGQDLQQLKKGTSDAEKITLSFYVKGNANATYSVEIYDGTNDRRIGQTFSVTTDWTRVILTFPADTTGALADSNAAGLYINWWLHAGATFTGGTFSTAWAAQTANQRAGNTTSFLDSTNRTFFLTGVQLEVGSQATPFEHRSFGEELQLCKRYCQQFVTFQSQYESVGGAAGWGFSSTGVLQYIPLDVQMRIEPAISHNDLDVSDDINAAIATTAIAVNANVSSPRVLYIECTVSSGITQYRSYHLRTNDTSDGKLICDAEL